MIAMRSAFVFGAGFLLLQAACSDSKGEPVPPVLADASTEAATMMMPSDAATAADRASCKPTTCAALGYSCGSFPDGCGGTLACGSCAAGQSCGAGGPPGVCGAGTCVPETDDAFCARLGASCGSLAGTDNCGQARDVQDCGSCPNAEQCGGGGTPNVCYQCTPTTCAALGASCGAPPDGCGATLQCGTCSSTDVCSPANTCQACVAKGASCSGAGSCCSGMSCSLSNGAGCQQPVCCVGNGATGCTSDADCCGYQSANGCYPTYGIGVCQSGMCCAPSGNLCNNNSECCGGVCTAGGLCQ